MDFVYEIFGPVRDAYRTIIVDPAARAQSLRRLRDLSSKLGTLKLEKDKFTRELLNSKWPDDQQKLITGAGALQREVDGVRGALGQVFEPLPDQLRMRGGEIQRILEHQLSGKWNSLKDIAMELGLISPSLEEFRCESKNNARSHRQDAARGG
jgi:hypothetical protein